LHRAVRLSDAAMWRQWTPACAGMTAEDAR
jgi:hypothetical protein